MRDEGPPPEPTGGEPRRQTASNSGPELGTDIRIAVVGAGSWGTTVASMLAERFDTTVWALEPQVAEAISVRHENPTYLAGFTLARSLRATTDLHEVVEDRQLLVMAVPAQHMRCVARQLACGCRKRHPEPSTWTFVGEAMMTKMERGALLPLYCLCPSPPVAPSLT